MVCTDHDLGFHHDNYWFGDRKLYARVLSGKWDWRVSTVGIKNG